MEIEEIDDIPNDRKCCYNCAFFDRNNNFCRRNPPQVIQVYISDMKYVTSYFPRIQMFDVDWCGEFEPNDEDEN